MLSNDKLRSPIKKKGLLARINNWLTSSVIGTPEENIESISRGYNSPRKVYRVTADDVRRYESEQGKNSKRKRDEDYAPWEHSDENDYAPWEHDADEDLSRKRSSKSYSGLGVSLPDGDIGVKIGPGIIFTNGGIKIGIGF